LYIGNEWRHCRASPLVLELWQRQERLDQNMLLFFFGGVYFLWCWMISRRSLHFSQIPVDIF
jgi:hypothetical protein